VVKGNERAKRFRHFKGFVPFHQFSERGDHLPVQAAIDADIATWNAARPP
jgi:hypothetical protein